MREKAPRFAAFNTSAVVDRILSFDANKDHRIGRDELPERMEGLMNRGDKNHDGFLTADEVVAMVDTRRARPRPPLIATGPQGLADVIADLKLPAATHNLAMATVKAPLNVNAPTSVNLNTAMRKLLNDEDYENFVAASDRIRRTPQGISGGASGGVIID